MLIEKTLEELEDEEVSFFTAENGKQALQIIRDENPQLVFLDVMMPKMNGMEVCRRVKKDLGLENVFIVLLTAKGQELDRQKGLEVGADLYMTKPFDPEVILNKAIEVDRELRSWVKGDDNVVIISNMLIVLSQKEGEKKKPGSEVLNLYQEVNLIYNFSEKLAQTIEPAAIAQLTLDEAVHIIKSDTGVIFLWDEHSKQLEIVAKSGELFFKKDSINNNLSLLLKIILGGQSEIMDDIS